MGIDPGTNIMGYGVLKVVGTKASVVAMGVIDLRKAGDVYMKLGRIFERVTGIIDSFLPDELAIEAPFFGKNVQSMLKLGRAQGVAMAAAIHHSVPITEYAPLKIKMAITGNGSASKEQVAAMLVPVFLPFTLIKGGINAGLTLLIYKPVVNTLRKAKLVAPSKSGSQKSFNLGFTLFAAAVFITFVLFFLVLAGVI